MFLMMFVWIFVIVGLIFILNKQFRSENYALKKIPAFSALEILKQRYARGEIDQVEFETQKRALAD